MNRVLMAIVLLLIVLALISLTIMFKRKEEKEVNLSALTVAWPPAGEISARWCGSGTRMASAEAAIISCDDECYALMRYWVFFPADVEVRREIPIEIWKGDSEILEENVTMLKEAGSIYIQTPVLLVKLPRGSELRIGDSRIRIPDCAKGTLRPPQVIYTRGIVRNWETPAEGLDLVKLSDHIFLARWKGQARISCGDLSLDLKELDVARGELAIIAAGEGCEIEVSGRKVPL